MPIFLPIYTLLVSLSLCGLGLHMLWAIRLHKKSHEVGSLALSQKLDCQKVPQFVIDLYQ